ncbi:MAG: hypothetical protein WDZ27_06885 [Waddliaceae bacterium]
MAAALIPINAVENNQTLNDLISIDQEGQITINNREEALRVLWTHEANSVEYRAIQIAFQIMNCNDQDALKEQIDMSKREIKRLLDENREIRDELTLKQIKEDAAALSKAERNSGIIDILLTPLCVIKPDLMFNPITGLYKILVPGSKAMKERNQLLKVYQTFHPNASLYEAYNYVKDNPLKCDFSFYSPHIEEFQSENTEGTYKEWVNYVEKKWEFKLSLDKWFKQECKRSGIGISMHQ